MTGSSVRLLILLLAAVILTASAMKCCRTLRCQDNPSREECPSGTKYCYSDAGYVGCASAIPDGFSAQEECPNRGPCYCDSDLCNWFSP
uniref:TIL domain-containing protein n=1 Tax=Panagrellus redivivus TaxID=6233 RepID=A0A7E4W8U3_PANRE